MAPASRLGALRTGEGSHGARRSRRSGPSVAGPGRGRLSVVRRRSAVENRPVQRSSPVTPLQQNTSAASLSVLAHSPVARDAKANFVSFVPFRACCEEPGWGVWGGQLSALRELESMDPPFQICCTCVIMTIVTVRHSSLPGCVAQC